MVNPIVKIIKLKIILDSVVIPYPQVFQEINQLQDLNMLATIKKIESFPRYSLFYLIPKHL